MGYILGTSQKKFWGLLIHTDCFLSKANFRLFYTVLSLCAGGGLLPKFYIWSMFQKKIPTFLVSMLLCHFRLNGASMVLMAKGPPKDTKGPSVVHFVVKPNSDFETHFV